MAKKTEFIRARIEPEIKEEAEKILEKIGVSVSTAICLLYKKIIDSESIAFMLDQSKKKK
jgi:DNA-damage-inducible protein J